MNRFQFENHGRIEIIRLFIEKSYKLDKVLRYDSLIFTFVIKKEQKRKRKQKQKNSYPKKKKKKKKKLGIDPSARQSASPLILSVKRPFR